MRITNSEIQYSNFFLNSENQGDSRNGIFFFKELKQFLKSTPKTGTDHFHKKMKTAQHS
jgi:hypothetical protein